MVIGRCGLIRALDVHISHRNFFLPVSCLMLRRKKVHFFFCFVSLVLRIFISKTRIFVFDDELGDFVGFGEMVLGS